MPDTISTPKQLATPFLERVETLRDEIAKLRRFAMTSGSKWATLAAQELATDLFLLEYRIAEGAW